MKSSQHVKSGITSRSAIAAQSSSKSQGAELVAIGTPPAAVMTPEERWQAIAQAAYYLAEARGFQPGSELADWLTAEAQIDKRLH